MIGLASLILLASLLPTWNPCYLFGVQRGRDEESYFLYLCLRTRGPLAAPSCFLVAFPRLRGSLDNMSSNYCASFGATFCSPWVHDMKLHRLYRRCSHPQSCRRLVVYAPSALSGARSAAVFLRWRFSLLTRLPV